MTEDQNNDKLIKLLEQYEKDISYKKSGDIADRMDHVLSEYQSNARNSLYTVKNFAEDVKTQFKALEIITEGLTDEGLNHTQKRVIANHMIHMFRKMVDRIDNADFSFHSGIFDRFNFFRSNSPERRLFEERKEHKRRIEVQDALLKKLKEKHPEIMESLENEIPF